MFRNYKTHRLVQISRFLISGAIGLLVNIGTFHILLTETPLHYLAASSVAFCIAAIVGFLLQKFWTFKERSSQNTHLQFVLYVLLALMNLGVNATVVYVAAGMWHMNYYIAQFAGAAVVAVGSFFAYRHGIFREDGALREVSL